MTVEQTFLEEHVELTRRFFLLSGAAGSVAMSSSRLFAQGKRPDVLKAALAKLESYLTAPDDFRDVSRGKPIPHTLTDEQKTEAGLTRDTWKLEVIADPENRTRMRFPLTKQNGKAITFSDLMAMGEKKAVRFAKVMTCLNIGCPLGMGIWEGVPLREVIWQTQPRADLRRVFFYGYHNNDPKQLFRSSLPVGRILEDPFDLPPVILCYKLNGQWLTSERGGPVRIVVPEAYGFKSIKWLSHVVLSNLAYANDTYMKGNNDVDSPLKTFAATLEVPNKPPANQPLAITGYAQVGISGLSRVQVCLTSESEQPPAGDRYFDSAPWVDAEILGPPRKWGGGIATDRPQEGTMGFTADGTPKQWPMRLAKVHWAILLSGRKPGKYKLRSRTIDEKGFAQPRPRPFRKSGHSAIEEVSLEIV